MYLNPNLLLAYEMNGTRECGIMMMPSQGNLHLVPREDYELIATQLCAAALTGAASS